MRCWMVVLMIGLAGLTIGCSDTIDDRGTGNFGGDPTNNVVPGDPDAPDYCEEFGWYGDGQCDEFCKNPDPDCGESPDPCAGGCNSESPPEPGPTPSEPDPPAPECRDGDDPDVEYHRVGESCYNDDWGCDEGWEQFHDDCGCGCVRTEDPPVCTEPDTEGIVHWVSRDGDECERIRFACPDGQEPFSNECGCGCIEPLQTGPIACLDDSRPEVVRMGNTQECTLLDFGCDDGWERFDDDCGCGCVVDGCSVDADCPDGYCGEVACPTDAACPMGCFYQNCDEPTDVICDAEPHTCPAGQTIAARNGCWECVDARTCEPLNIDG